MKTINKKGQAALNIRVKADGFSVKLKNKLFCVSYPKTIWENYPEKEKNFLIDNLSYLLTITFPLVSGFEKVCYNTSYPFFKPLFQQTVIRDIPSSTQDYGVSTSKAIKFFLNIQSDFKNYNVKKPIYRAKTAKNRIVIPLSFGKDSLLTLAAAKEIGLEPICVYINDTVSGLENRWKLELTKKLSSDFNIKCFVINNQIEKLNDFEYWKKDESSLGYAHMIPGFCFLVLPFTYFFNAKYIALGNQWDMNFSFQNKEGYYALPSFDQSSLGTKELDTIIKSATNNRIGVISLIEPLTNLAITKILNYRYPNLAKLAISCDSLNTLEKKQRWCLNCSKCARIYIFMKAWGIDVKKLGFQKELLDQNSEKLYRLFNGNSTDNYEKSLNARDQQLLAFYLVYKNGVKGCLIDKFRKEFLGEAERRKEELKRKFLHIYSMENIPDDLKNKIKKIYHPALRDYL